MEMQAETPRTRNEAWGFYGTCRDAGHTDVEAAWNEMMGILTDPKGRFRLEPEVARDLLDSTWGRHLADALVGESPFADAPVLNDRRWIRDGLKVAAAIIAARADEGN